MDNDKIYLSDSFEIFLKYLYGQQNYHQDSGLKTYSEWKQRLNKIINSIERSIDSTIEISDKKHKDYLFLSLTPQKSIPLKNSQIS
jgi:hypothetical protein